MSLEAHKNTKTEKFLFGKQFHPHTPMHLLQTLSFFSIYAIFQNVVVL